MRRRRFVSALSLTLFTLPAAAEEPAGYETVVSASRTERALDDAPVSTLLIGRREIEASRARDLAELLETVPGVAIDRRSAFGAGVQLQGLSSRHVLVLVDGQRLTGASGDRLDLTRLPLEHVAQIEIVKGASSSLYGSEAMGGVIHLRTRRAGRPLEGNAKILGGSAGWDATGTVATAQGGSLLRLTGGMRQQAPYRLTPNATATSGAGTLDGHLELRGEHRLSRLLTVAATANYLHRDLESVDAGQGRTVFDRRNQIDTLSLTLQPRLAWDEDSALSFSLHTSHTFDTLLQDQRGSSALDQLQRSRQHLWQGGVQWDEALGAHRVSVGVDVLHERLDSPRLPADRGERTRPAVFVQDDIQLADGLAITPGLRFDHDTWFGSHLSPKIALRASPWEPVTVRLSYGQGFRAPDFQELLLLFDNPSVGYRVEGNPDLRPETSHSATAGVEVRASRWLSFEVGAFLHRLDDLIQSTPLSAGGPDEPMRFGYRNIGEARSQGIETMVRLRPVRALRLELAYTLTDARNLSDDRPLGGRALHRATLSSTWTPLEGTQLTARGAVVGERIFFPLEGDGRVVSPPYAHFDLRASQRITGSIDLLGGVDNVFDTWQQDTLPIRPRSLWAGVSISY